MAPLFEEGPKKFLTNLQRCAIIKIQKKKGIDTMKIIDKRNAQTVDFRTLDAGQPFYYPDEEYYAIRLAEETACGENAVDIEDGELALLDEFAQVIPINGHFEILG